MDDFVWYTFQRLQGIATLGLRNLTPEGLVKLTDFAPIPDLIDMGLIDIGQDGALVVQVELTQELAGFVCGQLMHLAHVRANDYSDAKAKRLPGVGVYRPGGVTLH